MNKTRLHLLIEKAREKDQNAQTQLINYFWVDVFTFILKKVGDEQDADEITVSVFSKVLNKLDLFDPQFEFKTWVLTIAQNSTIDYWRKRSRENSSLRDDLDAVRNEFAESPEELLISGEENQKVQEVLSSMDKGYRDIIYLRFFEEKSIKEIAEELGLSISNTKVRIMRAKKVLAGLLKEEKDNN